MDAFLDILRELVSDKLFTFIAGFIFGVLACCRFCPAYWQWRTHRFDVEREDRLRKEQERKDAEDRRKAEAEQRAAQTAAQERWNRYQAVMKGVTFNTSRYPVDESGKILCPECLKNGKRTLTEEKISMIGFHQHCPFCNWEG